MSPPIPHPPDLRAQERALRILEAVEDLVCEVLLTARNPARSRAMEEAARLAADAEHAVLLKLDKDPEALTDTLVRIRSKLRTMADDLANARRNAPPTPKTVA